MRDPEYDRFGPWVIEITEEDPLPPLFVRYVTREEEPLLSVKIPRNIERRNAHPGMNLYDYLVSLYEDDLVILQRIGEEDVREETLRYDDIQFMRHGENLLKGTLHLGTAVGAYDLPFNTTSKEIMRRLVDLVRERYSGAGEQVKTATATEQTSGELSYYFTRLLEQERKLHPENRLLAAQADTPVGFEESNVLRRMFYGAASKTLLESLHHCDGRELKITTRSKLFKYRWQTEYGANYYYIPLGKIKGVSWEEDAQNTAVSYLNLDTAGETVTFAFIRENPWIPGYERYLLAVTNEELRIDN